MPPVPFVPARSTRRRSRPFWRTIRRPNSKRPLCAELIFIDCNELSYDVRVYNDFSSVNHTVHCDADGDIDSPEFAIGLPAQIVVVTIVYPYEPLLPNPLPYAGRDYKSAAEGGCNGLSMRSILVFRNEPFPQA